ncbi:MAG: response regulator [Flavobacteriales bacterium]|nr:response regulator [Flavobacteriales bacterium]MCB9196268.1 response regulator [Flavobacteriales bacterium]MCB9198829.1 response regulator [Flavobacteriales bacterium]
MIRAIVIDDELLARENLKLLIEEFCEGVQVVGLAGNIKHGAELIESTQPDVVFLDIRMPSGAEGFDLLDSLSEINFEVVFVTAFKDYAIQAFKANAIDYILKPVEIEELQETVGKIKDRIGVDQEKHHDVKPQINSAFDSIRSKKIDRITVPQRNGIKVLETKNISHLESKGNYTIIHFKTGEPFLDSRTLKVYQEILPDDFIRVHNSHVVNGEEIMEYTMEDGHSLILRNGDLIPVSRTFQKTVKDYLARI